MNDAPSQATRAEAIGGRYDPWLFAAALALAGLGVVMVGSASIAMTSDPFHYLSRHVVFLGLGIALAWAVMRLELKTLERYNQLLLLACVGLLLVVFLPGIGVNVNGARRWINLGFVRFWIISVVLVLVGLATLKVR